MRSLPEAIFCSQKLNSSSHSLTVVDGTNTLRVSDVPLFDVPFVITKVDANTNGPQGSTSFSGAVFRWEYYDNTSWSSAPKATWYFATDANGKMQYLKDGRLELSNNRAERSIKPFVIDRKNFLFANTPKGATGSAVMFSLIQTAIENGLDNLS